MLRKLSRTRISTMLSLSKYWKILVIDNTTLPLLNTLYTLSDLHDYFVTTIVSIKNNRTRIPDIDAFYFISATEENIELLIDNIESNLYNRYYLNFINSIPRILLEELCNKIKSIGRTTDIVAVYDQHMDYIPVETYMAVIEDERNGLYSVFYSLGEKPYILYKDNECDDNDSGYEGDDESNDESYSNNNGYNDNGYRNTNNTNKTNNNKTNTNTHNNIKTNNTESLFHLTQQIKILDKKINNSTIPDTHTKPLLLYFDRSEDIITPLKHTLSYNILLKDLLNLNNNTVIIKEHNKPDINAYTNSEIDTTNPHTKSNINLHNNTNSHNSYKNNNKEKIITINPEDEFWLNYANKEIFEVAEAIEKELIEYKRKLEMTNNLTFKEKNILKLQKQRIDTHMILINIILDIINEIEYTSYNNTDNIHMIKKGRKEDIIRYILTNKHTKEIEEIKEDRNINIDYTLYKERDILSSLKYYIKQNKEIMVVEYVEEIIQQLRNNNLRINIYDYGNKYSDRLGDSRYGDSDRLGDRYDKLDGNRYNNHNNNTNHYNDVFGHC
ncbi:SEC1 family transport protein SLY1, partial [Spraguea lophii 42_110]